MKTNLYIKGYQTLGQEDINVEPIFFFIILSFLFRVAILFIITLFTIIRDITLYVLIFKKLKRISKNKSRASSLLEEHFTITENNPSLNFFPLRFLLETKLLPNKQIRNTHQNLCFYWKQWWKKPTLHASSYTDGRFMARGYTGAAERYHSICLRRPRAGL